MKIEIHPPEESTLAEWCDKFGVSIVCNRKDDNGPWRAILDKGAECETGWGVSPERAVRHLANGLSNATATIDGKRKFVPKLTGIRTPGDWESFTVEEST